MVVVALAGARPAIGDEDPQVIVNGVQPPAAQTTPPGGTISVVVTNGPGNATDWVGLYRTEATDEQSLDWRYLNGSTVPPDVPSSTGTVLFVVPGTPGDYEVRLFSNNSYTRLATSGTIVVPPSACTIGVNGALPPSTVDIPAGGTLDVAVAGGPGNPNDWIGLFLQGAPGGAYVNWQYLNGSTAPPLSGASAASLRIGVPAVRGTYELRLFAGGGFTRVATSAAIVVSASTAMLAINGIAAPEPVQGGAGSMITVTVSGGPANTTDWIGLYRVGASDGGYVDWRYLSGTMTPPPASGSLGPRRPATTSSASSPGTGTSDWRPAAR